MIRLAERFHNSPSIEEKRGDCIPTSTRFPMPIGFIMLLSVLCVLPATVFAQDSLQSPSPASASAFTDDFDDPENRLAHREERVQQRKGLIEASPLQGFQDWFGELSDNIYGRTDLRLGLALHHVFQWADTVIEDTDSYATATDFDVIGNWKFFNKGEQNEWSLFFNLEGRWDYGTLGPQTLGFVSVGTSGGTANSFVAYSPAFTMRQIYLQRGSTESKWGYRIGKVTIDGLLTSSRHINPNTTFLPNAGTGMFVNAPADSGLGVIGRHSFNESWSALALITDANADRRDMGDISAGDFYKAAEVHWKAPKDATRAAGAKLTIWDTDGTKDGLPANGGTGNSGYGYSVLVESDLTDDGRAALVARYGRSYDGAAIYDAQAGLHFLLYQPAGPLRFGNDVFGAAINWVDSATPGAREEYNFETFYRFPFLPNLDMTVSYQYIKDPAVTREFDHSNVFSIRFTSVL